MFKENSFSKRTACVYIEICVMFYDSGASLVVGIAFSLFLWDIRSPPLCCWSIGMLLLLATQVSLLASKNKTYFLVHYFPVASNVMLSNPAQRCWCKGWAQSPRMPSKYTMSYSTDSAWRFSEMMNVMVLTMVLAWERKFGRWAVWAACTNEVGI